MNGTAEPMLLGPSRALQLPRTGEDRSTGGGGWTAPHKPHWGKGSSVTASRGGKRVDRAEAPLILKVTAISDFNL